jgi:hypothetical protein
MRAMSAFGLGIVLSIPAAGQEVPEWAVEFPAQPGDYRYQMERDPNGFIFVAGSAEVSTDEWDLRILKLDTSGALVPSWGTAGELLLDTGGTTLTDDLCNALKIDSSGRLYVLAARVDVTDFGAGSDTVIVRILPDGTLDPDWGTGGVVTFTISGSIGNATFSEKLALDSGSPPNLFLVGDYATMGGGGDAYIAKVTV